MNRVPRQNAGPKADKSGPLPPRPGWQSGAACRSEQVELFFGPEGENSFERRRREAGAVAVCQSCPVLARCRRHALLAPELHGVWGGLTSGQRSAVRRARKNRVA